MHWTDSSARLLISVLRLFGMADVRRHCPRDASLPFSSARVCGGLARLGALSSGDCLLTVIILEARHDVRLAAIRHPLM